MAREQWKRVGRAALAILLFPFRLLSRLGSAVLSARGAAIAILTLLVLIIAYYGFSDRYAPFTYDAYVQAYVVQVAPQIDGQVVAVHVKENQSVVAGQLLFEIDPRPYEHATMIAQSNLVEAIAAVKQLESDLAAARADADRVAADEEYAKIVFDQESEIYKSQSTTRRQYLESVQRFKAAQAAREKHVAVIQKTEQALAARIGEENALVALSRAKLKDAQLRLEWTKVYAPVDGFVTNVQLRPGAYAIKGAAVMTCIDSDDWWIVANFRENCLENVAVDQPVGITFPSYPGRIFEGRIDSIGWGVGEGQGVPSGVLPEVPAPRAWLRPAQRFQVRIRVAMPSDKPLRVGATANVTVYTNSDHWINPIADAWQHVVAWFDYL